jgi:hypothetical protein
MEADDDDEEKEEDEQFCVMTESMSEVCKSSRPRLQLKPLCTRQLRLCLSYSVGCGVCRVASRSLFAAIETS